jgi:aryl-alcohol dehydrogenase-like predicted oxidoreductase
MMLGSGGNPETADCVLIIHAAVDREINFVDTADMYSAGSARRSPATRSWIGGTTSCRT